MRFLGLREMASGAGILMNRRPAGWMWSRVAGDTMDLALLGAAFASRRRTRNQILLAAAAVAGVTALDLLCSAELSKKQQRRRRIPQGSIHPELDHEGSSQVRKTIIIDRSPEDLYNFWRKFENLPRIMPHLERVTEYDSQRSHWVTNSTLAREMEWDALVTEDIPNTKIAWRSTGEADVENAGSVEFEPATGGRGTMVILEMTYTPPAGKVGTLVAKLFRDAPDQQAHDALRFFKQFMETGVITTTKGQSAGRESSTSPKFDLAVPESAPEPVM